MVNSVIKSVLRKIWKPCIIVFLPCIIVFLYVIGAAFVPIVNAAEITYEVVQMGKGKAAEKGMRVTVHYRGMLDDGTVFDESYKRGEPFSFVLGTGQVIEGWETGIDGMEIGEKRVLTIPPELAYGKTGAGGVIPPDATLTFDVELISVDIVLTLTAVTLDELKAAQKKKVTIIDIRREDEWHETGIIKGAHTITAFTGAGQLHADFQEKFNALIPTLDTPFLLYCHSGGRTGNLGTALVSQLGYEQVSHYVGGIIGWIDEGEKMVPYKP